MRNNYFESIKVGRTNYKIRFVSRFESQKKGEYYYGEFDPDDKVIRIRKGLSAYKTIETLVHEIMHALEAEYGVYMPHHKIENLEGPIAKVIYNNFYKKRKK